MTKNPLIVFLTDFGLKDPYVGIMKGAVLSIDRKAVLIDITHEIEPHNVVQGAVILSAAYRFFPKGTIFVCVVDPGVGTRRRILCIRTRDYYFLAPDNGLLDAVCGQEKKVVARSVVNQKYFLPGLPSATFHGRDIFAPVAACLAKGRARPEDLGPVIAYRSRLKLPVVRKSRNQLKGAILYFDRFGNAITNICRSDARDKFWAEAEVTVRGHALGKLRKTYGDWARTAGALFGGADRLEIAYPCDSARNKISLKAGEEVTVTATVEVSGR